MNFEVNTGVEPDVKITLYDNYYGVSINEIVVIDHAGRGNGTYRVVSVCNNELGLERLRESMRERVARWVQRFLRWFR